MLAPKNRVEEGEPMEDTCPYCGSSQSRGSTKAKCAVCGMGITENHFPHIIRVDPEYRVAHLCSLACMSNYEHVEDGDSGG